MFDSLLHLVEALRDAGLAGLVALTILFAVGAMIFVPRPIMSAISGWVFGFSSVAPILVGSTAGSTLAFLLARYLFRRRFERLIAEKPRLKAPLQAVDQEGWRLVALLRLHSPLPGSLVSYLCGLTHMSVLSFSTATLAGIAPQVVLYVYLGVVGDAVLRYGLNPQAQLAFLVLGLLLMGIAMALVVRRTRIILAGHPGRGEA
ncbi:MAG: hypothetical protein K0S06_133 [Microvirga sp.]|nr:hypothetical protein [Microvirga sp.]